MSSCLRRSFLNDLRKQLLIWRSLDSTDKELFATSMHTRLNAKQGART